MSLFRRNDNLLRDSFFNDDFENEFFNHPLISFPSVYPYYHHHPMERLEKQLSKAFNKDVFKSIDFAPKVNLSEDEKNYYIHAELPGMTKDQVKMELSDDDHTLTISGERETIIDNSNPNEEAKDDKDEHKKDKKEENKKENKNSNHKKYSKIECSYGRFERSFSIPENANVNEIQAKMENGILEIVLPKVVAPKPEPKRIIQIQ